jgi:hypothetical protein
MRRRPVVIVVAGAAALWCATPVALTSAAAAGVARVGAWRAAIEVPGTSALNKGGNAGIGSMSCALAGDCAAGGYYTDRSGHQQAFVASERHGAWRAIEMPGSSALNKGGNADVAPVSCASTGDCAAGGYYTDRSGHQQAFVASERHGAWRAAIEVPGTGALNKGGNAQVGSMSCTSAGDCAAGGWYTDRSGHQQAFVASERHGAWRAAIKVPGTGRLNKGGNAEISSMSCTSAGNCVAGGWYTDRSGNQQAFVASERHGAWRAIEVPGTARLNKGGFARVDAVSCASAGSCAAGGSYRDRAGNRQAFVARERHGTWEAAIEVPGTGALNKGGDAEVFDVSCASAGSCVAGGWYMDGSGAHQAFVASETNDAWRRAIEVPGTGRLNRDGGAMAGSVSCASAGNCAAGGWYVDGSAHQQGFVARERHGAWRAAIAVPGTGALNKGGAAAVDSVSCASAGSCAASGWYLDGSRQQQAFVAG